MKLGIGIRLILSLAFAGGALPSIGAPPAAGKWSYAGSTGPARWAKLDKSFATCEEGQAQSPIDIRAENVVVVDTGDALHLLDDHLRLRQQLIAVEILDLQDVVALVARVD